MDEIYSRIKRLAQSDVVSKRVSSLPVDDCHCYEDSDQHAFSATHTASRLQQHDRKESHQQQQQHPTPSILQAFRDDENWNNPNGVMLMLRSYALQDEDQHWTLAHPVEHRLPLDELNYLKIKTEQYRAIAEKNIYEAARLLELSEIANAIQKLNEAIRYDDQNVNAFYLRAKAYIALMDWSQAHEDIEAALKLTPDCEPLLDLLQEVQSKRLGSTAWRGDHSAAAASSSSSSGAVKKRKYTEASDTKPTSRLSLNANADKDRQHSEAYPLVHADTILRLQSSLQAEESASSSSSSSSSSDDDGHSSSSSSSSRSSSKKKAKRRRRHSKHSKHKKAKHHRKHHKKEKKDKKSKSKDHKRS